MDEIKAGDTVLTKDGRTGTVTGDPGFTASGWVADVKYDPEFAHLSPVGGSCYGVEDLTKLG